MKYHWQQLLILLFFILFICRNVQISQETLFGALLKTRFLAEQIEFALQYPQFDELHYKLSEFLTDCINILARFCKIINCPEEKMFFIGGNVKCQGITLADMLVQSISHTKKASKSPYYTRENVCKSCGKFLPR